MNEGCDNADTLEGLTPAPTHPAWPAPGEHLFDKWTTATAREGAKPPTQTRRCIHPQCKQFETRIAPVG